jgi:hypothetical protein
MRILIIGGGIFGTSIATTLANEKHEIDIAETENDILQLASKVNHNRIHLGYHYLRSIKTAEQSIEGLLSFLFNYGKAVIHQLPNYYAIAAEGSKTTPAEFINFCNNVGIGYDIACPDKRFLDPKEISECFKVPEPVWDYAKLKQIIKTNLRKKKVNLLLQTPCIFLKKLPDETFEASFPNRIKEYDIVINTSYLNTNTINSYLGLPKKKMLFENVIIPVFKYKSQPIGLTIMDGPFCSVMPRGGVKNEFLLYHVKHSIVQSQISGDLPAFDIGANIISDQQTERIIYQASSSFMPFLKNADFAGFTKTVRMVHQNSDDARITELNIYPEVKNYFSVFSGKVTTCIQVALEIKQLLEGKQRSIRMKV